jgi:hypothetical protein
MQHILDRLTEVTASYHDHDNDSDSDSEASESPNTCLIDYYGREVGQGQPRDYDRLRMHRDGEQGAVIMLSIGQLGLLEFLDTEISADPELCLWTRHRSVTY